MHRHISYKTLYIALAVVTCGAVASCASDAPELTEDSNVIVFACPEITLGGVEVASRGQMLQTLPENERFGVIAYCIPLTLRGTDAKNTNHVDYLGGESDWVVKKSTIHPGLIRSNGDVDMLMQPIMYDGTKCVYSDGTTSGFSHPVHWLEKSEVGAADPSDMSYTFIAYHPYSADWGKFELMDGNTAYDASNSANAYNVKGAPRLRYTSPYQRDAANVHDMTRELDPELAKDAMVAVTYNRVRAAGAIPLKFDHIQSGIRFQINNMSADKELKISNLSISGTFYDSAIWDFSEADPRITVNSENVYSGYFPFVKAASPMTVPRNRAMVPGTDADHEWGTTVLLLPDLDFDATNVEEKDHCYLGRNKVIHVTYAFDGDADKSVDIPFTLGRVPEMGKLYTLNLNFIGNQILLMFTADATEYWQSGCNSDIIIN